MQSGSWEVWVQVFYNKMTFISIKVTRLCKPSLKSLYSVLCDRIPFSLPCISFVI